MTITPTISDWQELWAETAKNSQQNSSEPFEKEAREQGAGGIVQMGIRPHPNENHLAFIGGLRPMLRSAPQQESGVFSPCLFVESYCEVPRQLGKGYV
ncbi:hypothetical protein [Nostoc sp.]|uniref:hypothetical protein n=1 Tax=Nostoc sp. TaxID=1180 RepID=UPI002FF9635D